MRTKSWTVVTFVNTGDVKPHCLGRPTGSVTLFLHEEYIILCICILRTPQIQLHEIENHIINSAFGTRRLAGWFSLTKQALYMLRKLSNKYLIVTCNDHYNFHLHHYTFRTNELLGSMDVSARGTPPVVRDYSYARWALHYSDSWLGLKTLISALNY